MAGPSGGAGAPVDGPERVFRLVVEYDGTDFEGWQLQPGPARTVQRCLEGALGDLCGGPVRVAGAGRTDAGVHAAAQVASVRLHTRLSPDALCRALNARLPRDLAVREVALAPDDFHARRWSRGKLYRYQLWNGAARSPRREREWAHEPRVLDVGAMRRAARDLIGRHDFACFRASGSSVRTSVRTLRRLDVEGEAGGEIVFELEGEGFLRHMVRNVVGTLVQVGLGRREVGSLPGLLASRDRSLAGPTAAARGLVLVRVDLGPPPGRHST